MQLKDFPLSITVAACVTGAALVANVFAEPKDRPTSINIDALQAAEEKRFADADADGDGLVSAEEFAALDSGQLATGMRLRGDGDPRRKMAAAGGRRGPDAEAIRQRMDERRAKVEKRIVEREKRHQEARARDFGTADSDGDGQLSAEEYSDMPARLRATRQREMFARLDENEDGVLTPEEFPSRVPQLTALDADGDGILTREEMRAGRNR